MKSKRVLAAIISLLAAFSLLACKSSKQTAPVQVDSTVYNNVVNNVVTAVMLEYIKIFLACSDGEHADM